MKEDLRSPKPYDEVKGTQELALFFAELHRGEVIWILIQEVMEVIGPLTVRERWELLGMHDMKSVRENINLEGSAYSVASGMVDYAIDGYPSNVLFIQWLQRLRTVPEQLIPKVELLLE